LADEIGSRGLSYWSVVAHDWVLEGGRFGLDVGASSRDLRLRTIIEVPAPALRIRLDGMSTLQRLHCAVGIDETGRPAGIVGNPRLVTVIGNFPISTLAAFPGLGIDDGVVETVVKQVRAAVG
jgi:beta-glucosidase